ncbi:MAG TPA: HlyD family efflux transporter periplasmic adaptor subunit [Planctomycetota bacterium]|nr:HlyD family efflux transporter periplasmic adaptor subunit [Planctomycetota bacterium]
MKLSLFGLLHFEIKKGDGLKVSLQIAAVALVFLLGAGLAYDFGGKLNWGPATPHTATVHPASFAEELRLSGIVEARDIRPVFAGVTGTVEWMIDEGTFVTPGTTIIKFDASDQVKAYDNKKLEFDQNKQSFLQQFRYAQRTKELQRLAVVSARLDVEETCINRDLSLGLPVGYSWRQVEPTLPAVPVYPVWQLQGGKSILDTLSDPVPSPQQHPEYLNLGNVPVPELAENVIADRIDPLKYGSRYLRDDLQNRLDDVFAPPQGDLAGLHSAINYRQSSSDRRWAEEDLRITVDLQKQGLQSLAVLQAKQQAATAAQLTAQRDEILDRLNLLGAADSTRRQADFGLLRQTLTYRKIVKDAEAEVRKIDLDLLAAKLKVDNTLVDLKMLEDNLTTADTKAPINGVVAYVDIWKGSNESLSPLQIGDSRNTNWDLCKIADTAALRVRLVLDESDYSRVHTGQPATVRLPSFPELVLDGEVEEIQAYADDRNAQLSSLALDNRGEAFVRAFNVYVKLKNIPDAIHKRLRLGLTAEVDILRGTEHTGLALPPHAIDLNDAGQTVVYVVDSTDPKGYREVAVKVGSRTPERVEVLETGSEKIIDGQEVLFPGMLPKTGGAK